MTNEEAYEWIKNGCKLTPEDYMTLSIIVRDSCHRLCHVGGSYDLNIALDKEKDKRIELAEKLETIKSRIELGLM